MTREQAKQNLISIGVTEPTDEQITNYLNQVSGETKKEKDKVAELKAKAEKADELQTKINELETGNLTEIEKANKALEEANKTIADMQKSNAIRDQRESLMESLKITAEQAKAVVKDDGSYDNLELGKIMSEKETASAQAMEKKIADGGTNPGGGSGSGSGNNEEKTADVLNAESISFGNASATTEAKNHYVI